MLECEIECVVVRDTDAEEVVVSDLVSLLDGDVELLLLIRDNELLLDDELE